MQTAEQLGEDGRTWKPWTGRPVYTLEMAMATRYFDNALNCYNETGAWMVAFDDYTFVDGWAYGRVPVDIEDADARRAAYQAVCRDVEDAGTDMWTRDIEPAVRGALTLLRRRRPRTVALPGLVAHVDRCMDAAGWVMGDLHWRFAFSMRGSWATTFAELTGRPAVEAAECLRGIDHQTTRLIARLRQLARLRIAGDTNAFDDAMTKLLRDYGRRTGNGYGSASGFESPTWSLAPDLVVNLVDTYARQDLDALDAAAQRSRAARQRAISTLRRRLPEGEDRVRLEREYAAAVREVRGMENHNHLMEQETEGTLREAVHRLGVALVGRGVIDHPDDVIHIAFDELQEAVARRGGPPDLRARVETNRTEREARIAAGRRDFYGPPPAVGAESPFSGPDAVVSDGGVRGTPASPGQATGRVVVAVETSVPPDVAPGDILVARDAGPAWTPIFPLLAAVVLDEGAVYQHAALVAREYGIPCVVGARTAMATLTDGQLVTVDGTAGTVDPVI